MAAGGSKEMEIAIKIGGKVENSFKNALGAATKALGGFTGAAAKGLWKITEAVSAATTAAAAAVGALGMAAINTGAEFEKSMSQVAATMLIDRTTEEGQRAFETLENAARECGASTAFSATEAAEALNYLALAGYDADKAATALPTVLKLAGAGAMDLAAASDMVTDSMSALGIEATGANLTQFSDRLAQTASKANTSVAQLGEAILTVGGTAKGLAGGTVELNTALGILADNGLKGSEGGTHLRNIILSLQNPTDKAAAALESLGVDVYDAKGRMRGLNDIFKELQGAMDGMSNADKDAILSKLFNKTDLAAANAMLANCTDRFDELSAAIEGSAGACENMYAIQLDNLNGDMDILKSALSDLGISVYKDLNGPLREMTQLATSMVGELSEAYKAGGMEGMVGAVGGCLAETVDVIADYAPEVVGMGIGLLESFIGGIGENSGSIADAAAEVLSVFIDGLFALVPQVILAGIDIAVQFVQSLAAQLPQLISTGTQAIVNFVNGIIQRLPKVITAALTLVQTLVNSIGQNAPMLIGSAIQLIGNLVLGMASMIPQLLQMGVQLILSLAQGINANLPQLLQMGVQVIISLVSGITEMLPMLIQGGIQLIISLIQGIIGNLGSIAQAAVQIVLALITGLISAIPQLIAAIPQLIMAIIDAIFSTDWTAVGGDIISGIADGFMSGFFSLVDSVKGLWDNFTGWLFGDDKSDKADNKALQAPTKNSVSAFAAALGGIDTSEAVAAGTQAGEAFSAGLADSMAVIDTSSFNATMATAGTDGVEAFISGLNSGLGGFSMETSTLNIDTSWLTATLTAAGGDGMTAISAGMGDNSYAVLQTATALGDEVNIALDDGWNKANTSAQTAMQRLTATVTDAARSAASAVKAAFENMTIRIPKPKIPVINVSTSSVAYGGGSVNVPNFSVSWNALGGIFGQPTIFSTPAGMQGVGEKGPEAVLPLDTLWAKMKAILNEAIAASSGASLIGILIEKLKGIGGGGRGGQPELAGGGGPTVQYSPVYNLYGSAGKEEAMEADRMNQARFNKMMQQYEKDRKRRDL